MENKNGYAITSRIIGAHNLSKDDRQAEDYYATDPVAAEWLLKIEDLKKDIWECACGEGHLAKVFIEHGYNVRSTDLIDRKFGRGGVDFLDTSEIWWGDIVTNPPFKYAQEFIEHALSIVPNGSKVCMFLKVQFLEGKTRKEFYEKYPPKRIWVSSSRIEFGRNGKFDHKGSMLATAWYVWEKGFSGETTLKWFN